MSHRSSILLLIASQLLCHLSPVSVSVSASALPDLEIAQAGRIEHVHRAGPGYGPEVLGSSSYGRTSRRRADNGYTDPEDNGGYMLTIAQNTYPAGLGEPLNVILSADSDKDVLKDGADKGGFLNYMLSTNLGQECLGQHLGSDQEANLGDGQGNKTQVEVLRWNYGNPYVGTCRETFEGGLHIRYWVQNTTGAYFIAASMEMSAVEGHNIPPNGYNLGRDYVVGNLTNHPIEPRTVSNKSFVEGTTSYDNYTYQTSVKYVSNLMKNSSDGVNHYLSVAQDGYPAMDGLVAVLTVKITERPKGAGFATIPPASPFFLGLTLLLGSIFTIF